MTSRNPQKTEGRAEQTATANAAVAYGFITDPNPGDGEHVVEVQPLGRDVSVPMEMPVMSTGDVNVPTDERIPVLFARRPGGDPVILSVLYTPESKIPDYEPGERVLGHPPTSSEIRFNADGTISITSENGATVDVQKDGTLILNGGDQGVITDVSASGTNSNGGITGLDITRNTDILI
jgi:hypothetical protein